MLLISYIKVQAPSVGRTTCVKPSPATDASVQLRSVMARLHLVVINSSKGNNSAQNGGEFSLEACSPFLGKVVCPSSFT